MADNTIPNPGASGDTVRDLDRLGAVAASDINMTGGLTVASGDTVSCSAPTYTALSA